MLNQSNRLTMKRIFARENESDINEYLRQKYGIVSKGIDTPWMSNDLIILSNGYYAECMRLSCDCGESTGWVVFDELSNVIDMIVMCDNCYESASYHDRI